MTIEQRLERLERQGRWKRGWRGLLALAFVAIFAGIGIGTGEELFRPEATLGGLKIKDDGGKTRIHLCVGDDRDGAHLTMYDAKGNVIWQAPK